MNAPRHHQTGAALIISMILLLVMTLIGVTAMQSTVLEEKMAGNFRDRDVAFQAAEAALRYAEQEILGVNDVAEFSDPLKWATNDPATGAPPPLNTTSGQLGLAYDDSSVDYTPASDIWHTVGSYALCPNCGNFIGDSRPRYIIKHISTSGSKRIFKITAYAKGKSEGTAVVLRSYYQRED